MIPFCLFFIPLHSVNFTRTHGEVQCKDSLIQACLKKLGGIIKKQGILSQRGVKRLEKKNLEIGFRPQSQYDMAAAAQLDVFSNSTWIS